MGKGGGNETVRMTLDPETQRYVENYLRPLAKQQIGGITGRDPSSFFHGPSPQQIAALGAIQNIQPGAGFEQFMGESGRLASRVGQAFDPANIQTFMDPFRADVVSGVEGLFARQRAEASTAAKQRATQAGGFGGARSALMEAQALRDVNLAEAEAIPRILSGGYSQALNAALGQHQLGQQTGLAGLQNLLAGTQFSTGLQFQTGQAGLSGHELFRQLRERRAQAPMTVGGQVLNLANLGVGPYGQTQMAQGGPGNPLAGAFGGALTGLGAGGSVGALIGGGLGLLGGLF